MSNADTAVVDFFDLGRLADRAVAVFTQEFLRESVMGQFAAIALSIIVAVLVSRIVGARLTDVRARFGKERIGSRFVRFVLATVKHSLFSVVAALGTSLCVYVMKQAGVVPENDPLIFVRIAYTVFYSWAIVLVLMHFIGEAIGLKFFGPGLRKAVSIVFWTLAILHMVGILPEVVELMKSYSLPIGSDKMTFWALFVGIVTVLFTLGVANWIANFCEEKIMAIGDMELNLRVVIARISRVSLMVSAILVALSSAGINLTVLSVFGGAIGVGIGFGMQKIASNYVSGFIILFDRSVKIGDLVEVSGFRGVITQINTRYSVIRSLAGEELIVPNETFVTNSVKNFSLTDTACVVTADVSCAYESDVEQAVEIVRKCVLDQPRVMKEKAPWVIVTDFASSGVNIRAGFWVADPQNGTGGLKSAILCNVLTEFAKAGIEIPYEKMDLNLSGKVKVDTAA